MSAAPKHQPRRALDAYYTPDDVALKCLSAIQPPPIRPVMIEPSVGGGAFARAGRELWAPINLIGVDLYSGVGGFYDCDQAHVGDWLEFRGAFDGSVIVGNPPFSHAQAHVEHALSLKPKIAGFLLRLAFLESRKREAFWRKHPPAEVHVLSRRPSFTGGGTDSAAYAFFVWRPLQTHTHTTLRWIQ